MKREGASGILILSLAFLAHPARAQEAGALEPGSRIWVEAAGLELKGTLLLLKMDSLRLTPESYGQALTVATSQIERLRVAQPRSSGRGALRGLGWGALIGGGVGAVVSVIGEAGCSGGFCFGYGGAALAGGVVGGALGGLAGALIGSVAPGERWEDVDISDR